MISTDAQAPMQCEWVIGRYKGDRAKSIKAHAEAGIGYIIVDVFGTGGAQEVVAVFRRACDSPLPDHLQLVRDPYKIQKYEKIFKQRSGLTD